MTAEDLGGDPTPASAPPDLRVTAAAALFLLLAGLTFILPAIAGMALVLDPHGAAPSQLRYILPIFQPAEGTPLAFLQDYWKTLPALVGGAMMALPRCRKLASAVLFAVMAAVMILGTIILQYGQIESNLPAIAASVAETGIMGVRVAEKALSEMLSQIRQTREIAITVLAALAAAAVAAHAVRKETPQ